VFGKTTSTVPNSENYYINKFGYILCVITMRQKMLTVILLAMNLV